jgi:hypothetical protein
MPKKPGFDPYDYLARRRFPRAYSIVDPHPDNFTELRKREHYESQAAAFIEELRDKPSEEVSALVKAERKKEAREADGRERKQEEARFFNRPSAEADFTHWSRAAYWSLEEAVALSFGKDPRIVNWKSIEFCQSVSPFVKRYRDLRDLADRAVRMKQLCDQVIPGFYLGWARRMEITVDPRLVEHVTARGVVIADWKTMYDAGQKAVQDATNKLSQLRDELERSNEERARAMELSQSAEAERDELKRQLEAKLAETPVKPDKNLGTRERNTMVKLIIGMAVDGYGYEPDALRSSTVPEIARALQLLGIGLDEITIRKYLAEGKDVLPRDNAELDQSRANSASRRPNSAKP